METQNEQRRFSFNKIYVIESLPDNETQTGLSLYEDLLKWCSNIRQDVFSEYWGVQTKRQFELCLEALYIDTVFGCDPFIHFEIHGSSNYDGLVLKSNELISWTELAEMTKKINCSVNNNLVISFATCYSGYFIKAIDITKVAPFCGCVMTLDLLTISEIEIRFNSFFNSLLTSFDFDLAIQNLNEVYSQDYKLSFYTSEDAFEILFKKFLKEHFYVESEKSNWIQLKIDEYLNDKSLFSELNNSEREKEIKKLVLGVATDLEISLKKKFLMVEN